MAIVVPSPVPTARGYQQEMLKESIKRDIIVVMDTGSGKARIVKAMLQTCLLPVSVGLVSGALEPDQWKSATVWEKVFQTHGVIVSTPQVFLDALRHSYINLGRDISILVFDEAHHATGDHPYSRTMREFIALFQTGQQQTGYLVSVKSSDLCNGA